MTARGRKASTRGVLVPVVLTAQLPQRQGRRRALIVLRASCETPQSPSVCLRGLGSVFHDARRPVSLEDDVRNGSTAEDVQIRAMRIGGKVATGGIRAHALGRSATTDEAQGVVESNV